mgnify:FL=1
MRGFYTRYVPGWDTHGLPIETALVKTKKVNRNLIDKVEFRKMCFDYAMEQVDIQKVQFKRLGILGGWDNPYITLKPEYEASQLRVFADMVEKGLIFKKADPVDKRSVRMFLTEEGKRKKEISVQSVKRFNEQIRLALSEQELASFLGVISKIQKVIDQIQTKESISGFREQEIHSNAF